jgi:hypothetical protein
LESCQDSLEFILRKNRSVGEALVASPWFVDGLTEEEAGFINALRPLAPYTGGQDGYMSSPEQLIRLLNYPEAYVSKQISTQYGNLDIAVLYLPDRTERQIAKDVLELLSAYVPYIQNYLGIPYRSPDIPSARLKGYSVFIDAEGTFNVGGMIKSNAKSSMVVHGHETNHRYEFGPPWMEEGSASFLVYKFIAKHAKNPEPWFVRLANLAPGAWPLSFSLEAKRQQAENGILQYSGYGKILGEIPFTQFFAYGVPLPTQSVAVSPRLIELQDIMGESAMQAAYRQLALEGEEALKQITSSWFLISSEKVYEIFRSNTPQSVVPQVDAFFRKYVFSNNCEPRCVDTDRVNWLKGLKEKGLGEAN